MPRTRPRLRPVVSRVAAAEVVSRVAAAARVLEVEVGTLGHISYNKRRGKGEVWVGRVNRFRGLDLRTGSWTPLSVGLLLFYVWPSGLCCPTLLQAVRWSATCRVRRCSLSAAILCLRTTLCPMMRRQHRHRHRRRRQCSRPTPSRALPLELLSFFFSSSNSKSGHKLRLRNKANN